MTRIYSNRELSVMARGVALQIDKENEVFNLKEATKSNKRETPEYRAARQEIYDRYGKIEEGWFKHD